MVVGVRWAALSILETDLLGFPHSNIYEFYIEWSKPKNVQIASS